MPPNVINHFANEFFSLRVPEELSAIVTKMPLFMMIFTTLRSIRQFYYTFVTSSILNRGKYFDESLRVFVKKMSASSNGNI